MADLQTVVNGLDHCIKHQCTGCPYFRDSCSATTTMFDDLAKDALELLSDPGNRRIIMCKDCKYGSCHYARIFNQYVCLKDMDKNGRVSAEALKGHHGYWYCADGVRRDA